jgi:uncharacterized membrane protein
MFTKDFGYSSGRDRFDGYLSDRNRPWFSDSRRRASHRRCSNTRLPICWPGNKHARSGCASNRPDPNNIRNRQEFGEGINDSRDHSDGSSARYNATPMAPNKVRQLPAPLCSICGSKPATHVCQTCGKPVCRNDIDPIQWSCSQCLSKGIATPIQSYPEPSHSSFPTWLFFIAFGVIFVGILLMTLGSLSNPGGVSGGVIILIGPIPIVLGSGPYSAGLIEVASVLTVAAIVFFLVLRRRP